MPEQRLAKTRAVYDKPGVVGDPMYCRVCQQDRPTVTRDGHVTRCCACQSIIVDGSTAAPIGSVFNVTRNPLKNWNDIERGEH